MTFELSISNAYASSLSLDLQNKDNYMKSLFIILFTCFFVSAASAQVTPSKINTPDSAKKMQLAEVSCGSCKLGLHGKTCALAVRIADKAYYVDGAAIDDFGDAHAHDGMCNAIHKAEVQGELVDGRFKLSYIKLLPEESKKKN